MLVLLSWSCLASSSSSASSAKAHGELRKLEFGGVAAWDSVKDDWVTPKAFWRSYMRRSAGRTWGSRTTYPPFPDVLELDTVLIQFKSGPCLMEFFRSRWHRANDLQGWDPGFNKVGGCAEAVM